MATRHLVKKNQKVSQNSFQKGFQPRLAKTSPPLVAVTWGDACIQNGGAVYTQPGWHENFSKGVPLETVGFLLSENKDWLVIAMERDAEGSDKFREVQSIPTYSVLKKEVLREGKYPDVR